MSRISDLLSRARGNLDQQSGIKATLTLEQANDCSCCASQVCGCGCGQPGRDIDTASRMQIGQLSAAQPKLGVTPQCEINWTLCGKEKLCDSGILTRVTYIFCYR